MKDTTFETKREMRNGHLVEFIPIVAPCTYYHKEKGGECKNCHGTRKYVTGYYMIIDGKIGYTVDTIK